MTDPDDARGETARGYDALAERDGDGWESPWHDNPLQRHYSWPATKAMLPELADRRVLDAGCGVGDHVEWLLDRGATVVGVDASEAAVDRARSRFDDAAAAAFRRADLTEPLAFDGGAFDVVLSHLVLDHVAELRPVFEEFRRVLSDGGALVFAVVHPMQYYEEYDAVETYYDAAAVEVGWDDATVTSHHRPVGEILNALVGAGFRLDEVAEPRPREEYLDHAPERWSPAERPQILCVRARAD
ncbi:methyltransferase domain-containing protein [Halostella sp. JP-L12]|uniref:class I SAM-dependent methyltransferase n=1 Tax=Halostella TaxID=1843185 RepID=UPI000EF7F929|nr:MULTISPECIES: class I SAM-dependent methyltransferase [Halostella]NHN47243.1 methyltransferase domain-containing protein [Halostella sp. JP-L12]